jgi:hypothetical protein
MDLLHGLAGLLHGCQGLSVDVGRLDRVNLLLQGTYLTHGLFFRVLVVLLAPQGRHRRCCPTMSVPTDMHVAHPQNQGKNEVDLPALLLLTFFRAMFSCSSIWLWRYFSRFWSISSCDRSPRMAFLGLSLRFCAALPPNQPHMF